MKYLILLVMLFSTASFAVSTKNVFCFILQDHYTVVDNFEDVVSVSIDNTGTVIVTKEYVKYSYSPSVQCKVIERGTE